jgi:hypothetical protein
VVVFVDEAKQRAVAAGERALDVAGKIENTLNLPVYDLAAVLSLEATWLVGFLFAAKMVATGVAIEFREKR